MKDRIKENIRKCMKNFHYIAMASTYITLAVFGVVHVAAWLAR